MTNCRVIPLGSCSLTIPLLRLQKRKLASSALFEVGFTRWSLSFSPAAALQLVQVASGRLRIPRKIRELCYGGVPDSVAPDAAERLARADLVLIEISTPLEISFRRFILNHNRLRVFIFTNFEPLGQAAKDAAKKWLGSLLRKNEPAQIQHGRELLHFTQDAHVRAIIRKIEARDSGEEEIIDCFAAIRNILNLPIGVVIYNFRYMPDGRAVEWPAGFNDNVRAAARRLHIPVYDPGPLVCRHGVDSAIVANSGHYTYAFNEIVADEYSTFIASVIASR